MWQQLWQLVLLIRMADVFDIAFVALFIYAVLMWFKRTASRGILVGISLLGLVYFAARTLNMYMTTQLFHAAFAVLLVALIVVFQEDLRRLFERVGTLRGRLAAVGALRHMDIIVEVISELATKHIGALLVIRGLEPLDRHIEGGVVVDGQISKALLDSIFDPHSMGHDGAVILEGDRIRRFGVHLPLSHNLHELGQRGTRHSAALGLSDRTDALVIVVSEERGIISVARQGKLTTLQSTTALQQVLDDFSRDTFPQQTESLFGRRLRENALLKATSVALACAGWLVVVYGSGTVQKQVSVPIEYRNKAEGLVIDEDAPQQASVTFSGLGHAMSALDDNKTALKVSLDLSNLGEGLHRIPIDDDKDIRRPANINVDQKDPAKVTIQLRAVTTVDLPVAVKVAGRPPIGLQVGATKTVPASVRVRMWKSRADTMPRIFTEPIDVSQMTTTTTRKASLEIDRNVVAEPAEVMVTIEIVPSTPASP